MLDFCFFSFAFVDLSRSHFVPGYIVGLPGSEAQSQFRERKNLSGKEHAAEKEGVYKHFFNFVLPIFL